MSERAPVIGKGEIVSVREPGRLYQVRMANGYVAIAVLAKDGPPCPENELNHQVEVAFSPYDMSRSKIVTWLTED